MNPQTLSLSIEQARALIWPFRQPRLSIGDLIDRGVIGRAELHQAVRIAYSKRLRAACSALLEVIVEPPCLLRIEVQTSLPQIPTTCSICGGETQRDPRWDSAQQQRLGWRCRQGGLGHFLQQRYLPMLKAVYAADQWVLPAIDDYPGVRRRDLTHGPIGYWPAASG